MSERITSESCNLITENVNEQNGRSHPDDELVDFKIIFESIASPYVVLKPDFTIVAANKSYLELTRTENIINRNLFDLFPNDTNHPEDSGLVNLKASLDRVLKEKISDTVFLKKYNVSSPDLSEGPFFESHWQAANFPVFNNFGDLIYIIHHVDDFTNIIKIQNQTGNPELANLELGELKNLMDFIVEKNIELKKIRNFLELILKNIPNMVFVKDARDLKFISLNKAGEELLGYTQSDLVGKSDYDFFSKEQADFFTSKDRVVLSSGEPLDIPEEPIHTLLKGDRILHTKKVPVYDDQGKPVFLVGISEDITEKIDLVEARLAQKSAEEIALKKSKFLDVAAHELRTPITSLSLLLQLALRQIDKGNTPSSEIIGRLKEPAERLKRLVIDLLDMSRLERGLVELSIENSDLCQLVIKCVEDFRMQAPDRKFVLKNIPKEFFLKLDPLRINQVLSNFLDNAVKYTNEGEIEINVDEGENVVRVSVTDHGPGISSEQQKTLFSAFSRGSSESTIRASGLGLGLSVCKGIIELHKGRIGVESVEGEGSTFYFEIPSKE